MPNEWLDPGFWSPEPPPGVRPIGEPTPPSLPWETFDEMQYEPPQYLPPQRPDTLTRLLAPFSNVSYRATGGAPQWPGIPLGILALIAQSRIAGQQGKETERQSFNQRREKEAAWRNQRNLTATQTWLQRRASQAAIAGEKRGEARTIAGEERATTRKREEGRQALETGGLPIQTAAEAARFGRPVGARMTSEAWRAAFPERFRATMMGGAAIGNDELTPDAVDIYADQLASKGRAGISVRDIASQRRIANRAAQKYPGINLARNEAVYNANKNSLANLTKLHDGVSAFIETADKNVAVLDEYAAKIGGYDSPLANRPLRWLQKNAGSTDVAAYEAARVTVANEYTRILTTLAGSGQTTDSARKELDNIISGSYSLKQMREVLSVFARDARNRDSAYSERIAEITSRTGAQGAPSPFNSPAASDSVMMERRGIRKLVPRSRVEEMRGLGAKEVR